MNFRSLPIRAGGSSTATVATVSKNLTLGDGGKKEGSNTNRVRVYWGLVNNIQSDQFTAGDRIPLYFEVRGKGIIYVQQTANLKTRQWTSVKIINSDGTKVPDNTKTTIYTLLGTYDVVEDTLYVVSWAGGDISHSFCELSVN